MKKIGTCLILLLTGCPMAIDFSAGLGADQSIEKTVKIKQKQTEAQTNAGVSIVEDILAVIPGMSMAPTPVPTQQIQSVTIQFAATPCPTPLPPIIIEPILPSPAPRIRPTRRAIPKKMATPCPSLVPTFHNQ